MQMNESEVFDRWTILRMKVRLTENVRNEFESYDREAMDVLTNVHHDVDGMFVPLVHELVDLAEANAKIWVLEASLRQEFKDDPSNTGEVSDAEFGRRAKLIREHNKTRIKAKARIDALFGRNEDVKVDHASQ